MRAVVVTKRGGPDVIEVRDMPVPEARGEKGEVLVHVEAAGVNFADTVQSQGMYPNGPKWPYIPGLEFAGKLADGSRVMGFTRIGACAEQVVAPKDALFPIPSGWTAQQAAAFPVNYFTAYFAYWMAGMTEDDAKAKRRKRVLIHAVAGGVGTAAVEIGKLLGVEMWGTSSSEDKLAKVKELGLDHGINYKEVEYEDVINADTKNGGVDAVFEMLGGEHTATSTRCLADMGTLIVYGMATGQAPQFDFMAMFQRNLAVKALWLTPLASNAQLMSQAWKQLSEWIAKGGIKPIVGTELPLEKTAEAHRMLLERRNYGKVVLTI